MAVVELEEILDWDLEVSYEPEPTKRMPRFSIPPSQRNPVRGISEKDRSFLERITIALERIAGQIGKNVDNGTMATDSNQPNGASQIAELIGQLIESTNLRFDELNQRMQEVGERHSATTNKDFYTVKEVADRTPYEKWTIRDACNTGRIDGAEKGDNGKWRISHEGLEQILNYGLPSKRQGIDR